MALSAHDRIVLLRVKVERAKDHIVDLERELIAFRGKSDYLAVSDYDPETGEIIYKPMIMPIYSFKTLAIAGDAVHSLRSLLK